jgi:hypothetical protein
MADEEPIAVKRPVAPNPNPPAPPPPVVPNPGQPYAVGPASAYTPPAVAPTSEAGMWIEEMIRQGIITRAPGNIVATSVNPGGGLGWTDTVTGNTSATVGPEGKGDPATHNLVRNPDGSVTPAPTTTTPATGDLPYPGAPAWINSPLITPEERAWFIEHKYVPPPWAGDPTIPAPLAGWNRADQSGMNRLPDWAYTNYGGDAILEAIRKYDPNAQWSSGSMYGGEAGDSAEQGRRLDYDPRLLPAAVGNLGWMRPTSILDDQLRNAGMKYYDPMYGWVTDPRNGPKNHTSWWEYAAPLAISLLAPYAAPAIAGAMGVPAAAAGFTSGVTAGAAGLGAGSTPGSIFAAGGPGIPSAPEIGPGAGSWNPPVQPISGSTARTLTSIPQTAGGLGSQYVTPNRPPVAPRAPVTPAGATTPYTPQSYTPPRIARNQVMNDPYGAPTQQGVVTPKTRAYDPYGFDPTAFNSGGSTTRPRSNDSKLVATQFADDPYRFS